MTVEKAVMYISVIILSSIIAVKIPEPHDPRPWLRLFYRLAAFVFCDVAVLMALTVAGVLR